VTTHLLFHFKTASSQIAPGITEQVRCEIIKTGTTFLDHLAKVEASFFREASTLTNDNSTYRALKIHCLKNGTISSTC
jgi:hypothetical protein